MKRISGSGAGRRGVQKPQGVEGACGVQKLQGVAGTSGAGGTHIARGILFLVFSAFCFALMAVFARLAGDLPFTQKAFFRNLVALFVTLPVVVRKFLRAKKPAQGIEQSGAQNPAQGSEQNAPRARLFPKGSLKYLILRASAGSVGIFGNFYAIDRIPIADAAILNKMSPFFAVIFSLILLGEKIKLIPFCATVGAFLGAVFIIKPSVNIMSSFPAFVGFLGGMGAGFAYACVRKLKFLKVDGTLIIAFFSAFSVLLCVPFMAASFAPMTARQLVLLALTGLAGCGGQFGITFAYYNASARDISIFDYSQIIFSAALGFFIFGQMPDALSWTGYAIIILMAAVVFFYNRHRGE